MVNVQALKQSPPVLQIVLPVVMEYVVALNLQPLAQQTVQSVVMEYVVVQKPLNHALKTVSVKILAWTNKPDGTYPTDNVFGDITVTNPNSTNTDGTGVAITLNSETLAACPSDTGTCYTLSNSTDGYEVI
jgi:hypothetical protein